MHDLTIVIPVKNPPDLDRFIRENFRILSASWKVVVDSGGGERLSRLPNTLWIQRQVPMWEARRIGYEQVKTPFTLNLDVDTILPDGCVEDALALLRENSCDAVAIDYQPPQGHYAFGTSIWRTELLKKLYDYPPKSVEKLIKVGKQEWITAFQNGFCECTYMWARLLRSEGRLESLGYRAIHIRKSACNLLREQRQVNFFY
ncbi:glycosyltransferase family 2 protein [Candidatus Bathyarchaeota archaeon]|nr:glycosyltransferase family 2 protein [Candidatus Bathyarchaeota archaeon]